MILGVLLTIYYMTFVACNAKLQTQSKVILFLIYGAIAGLVMLLS